MPSTRMPIEHSALLKLIQAQRAQATITADPQAGGWGIVIRHGNSVSALAGKRGSARLFAKIDTAVALLRSLGLLQFAIDATAFDPQRKTSPRAARPDRALALRETHAAAAHLARIREQAKHAAVDGAVVGAPRAVRPEPKVAAPAVRPSKIR